MTAEQRMEALQVRGVQCAQGVEVGRFVSRHVGVMNDDVLCQFGFCHESHCGASVLLCL